MVADLAEALGLRSVAGRRASQELTREAVAWLERRLVDRTTRRFLRGLVPVVGIAADRVPVVGIAADRERFAALPTGPAEPGGPAGDPSGSSPRSGGPA